MSSELVLVREVEAREALHGQPIRERILLPPYPAVGLGALRVLRVLQTGDATELVCGYEGYERLG